MTSDDLADYVVAAFNDLEDQQFTFTAKKPEVVEEIEQDRSEFGVYVLAKNEGEEPLGDMGSTQRRTRVVSVVTTGRITSGNTIGDFLEQTQALREALEGTELGGYLHDRNEVLSVWDLDAARTQSRFLSLFEATYYTFS